MLARGRVLVVGAEHPDELADDRGALEPADGGPRRVGRGVLDDREVPVAERGDLRQVGDADDLAAAGEGLQLLAHRAGGLAADPRVDLVEDQRVGSAAALALGGDAHQRQHHPRELAARGRLAQRAGRHARVRGDHELDLVGARRAGAVLARGQRHGEARALHGQRRQPPADRVGEAGRRRRPRGRQAGRGLGQLGARGREGRLAVRQRLLGAGQLVAPGAAGLGVGEHRGERAAVLALEALELGEPLLDLVEAAGRRLDGLAVAAQLAREVVGLDGERARPGAQGVELGVDAADALERRRRAGQRRRRALAAVRRERADPGRRRPAQALEVAQALALALELGLLRLVGRRPLDLLELPVEQVELAVARARPRPQLLEL